MSDQKDLKEAEIRAKIVALKRREKLKAISEYIGFGISKLTGVGGIVGGGLELLSPDLLPIDQLGRPETLLGVGLAILAGKPLISLIVRIGKVIES